MKYNLSRFERSLSQIRLGILPLKVETGRFTNIPLQNRICDICKTSVEDELHFLFDCAQYTLQRNKFLQSLRNYVDVDNMSKVAILGYCFELHVKGFVRYSKEIYQIRQSLLYN